MSSIIDDICDLLDSYSGRDKVVRLACYAAKLYGSARGERGWQAAGSQLSAARLMLRLFDDVPTARHALAYGLGRHEPSTAAAALGVAGNGVDLLMLPVEKACWLAETGVLRLPPAAARRLDLLATALWFAGVYIALLQSLREVRAAWWRRACVRAAGGEAAVRRAATARLALAAAAAAKLALDVLQAGAGLPRGALWGGRLPPAAVAAAATASSLLGLGLYFARRRLTH